ncbi:MAG: AAA family ATPase, partial [Candidatus Aenigmarchaeota archaeon]|nr:AAA family ATPase [Candidatus Aenigmarchaeota archaeon]
MIITIAGQAGSGKSSVAEFLAKRLGFKRYSMGDLRRKAAYERGMTLAEFNKLGEKDDFTDRFVDELQEKLGKK